MPYLTIAPGQTVTLSKEQAQSLRITLLNSTAAANVPILSATWKSGAGNTGADKSTNIKANIAAPLVQPGTTAFGSWTATPVDDTSLPIEGSVGSFGYSKMPVAAWDTVMYDEFTDEFTIGVSAWKAPTYADYALGRVDGIKEVQFSADDGPWVTVATRGTSPRTGVGDLFLVRVRAADYATARRTEVRAKVIPWSGKPRILQGFPVIGSNIAQKFARAEQYSLALTANKDGALNRPVRYLSPTGSDANSGLTAEAPMATRDAAVTSLLSAVGGSDLGGCKLLLLPGTYGEFGQPGAWENAAGTNSEIVAAASRWVSVEAVTPGTVTMGSTTPRGLNVIKTKYKNISFVQGVIGTGSGSATNAEGALWIDGCSFNGLVSSDPETKLGNTVTSLGNGGLWFTASPIANHLNGPAGSNTVLAQNTHLDGVDGELFTDVRSVQQCSAKNSKRLPAEHPDTYQWRNHGADVRRNYVLYQLVADENIAAQGFFSDKSGQCNDAAVVDCSFGAVGVANAFILNNAPSNLFFLRLSVAPGTVKLAWTNTADNVRFVDNRTSSPRTYREGVSYLEAGMAASEPYDGPPPPSTIIEALGDSASGGKVTYVYDAIRTDKLTLILTEGDSGPRASYWSSTTTASLGLAQTTDALRPYYDTVGFKGIAPAVVYDKTDGSARVVGATSIPSPLSAQNECDIYMAVEHNVDAASPMATDTQYWMFAGASSSATGQFSIRRSIVGGLHRVSVYSSIGPSGGAVTSTINAYVEDASFIGPMIIRVKKRLGSISITVYNDANPNGITASTTTGSDVPTLPTSSTRFRIGSSYNGPLDQTVQGNILNLSITAPLTDEEAVLALNALREDGGFEPVLGPVLNDVTVNMGAYTNKNSGAVFLKNLVVAENSGEITSFTTTYKGKGTGGAAGDLGQYVSNAAYATARTPTPQLGTNSALSVTLPSTYYEYDVVATGPNGTATAVVRYNVVANAWNRGDDFGGAGRDGTNALQGFDHTMGGLTCLISTGVDGSGTLFEMTNIVPVAGTRVTVRYADPARPSRFRGISLSTANRVDIYGMGLGGGQNHKVYFQNTSNDCHCYGLYPLGASMADVHATDPQNHHTMSAAAGSTNCSVEDSEFMYVGRGVAIGTGSNGCKYLRNKVRYHHGDAVQLGSATDIEVSDNVFMSPRRVLGSADHIDGTQISDPPAILTNGKMSGNIWIQADGNCGEIGFHNGSTGNVNFLFENNVLVLRTITGIHAGQCTDNRFRDLTIILTSSGSVSRYTASENDNVYTKSQHTRPSDRTSGVNMQFGINKFEGVFTDGHIGLTDNIASSDLPLLPTWSKSGCVELKKAWNVQQFAYDGVNFDSKPALLGGDTYNFSNHLNFANVHERLRDYDATTNPAGIDYANQSIDSIVNTVLTLLAPKVGGLLDKGDGTSVGAINFDGSIKQSRPDVTVTVPTNGTNHPNWTALSGAIGPTGTATIAPVSGVPVGLQIFR